MRNKYTMILSIFAFLSIVVLCCLLCIYFILTAFASSSDVVVRLGGGPYVLVVAHPDDECMFFAPTALSLRGRNLHVLCVSSGEFAMSNAQCVFAIQK